MDVTVRAGLLGTGWIAQEHAIALSALPGIEIAVAGAMKSRTDDFVLTYKAGPAFTYDELVFEVGHRSLVLLEAAINSPSTGSQVSVPTARHSLEGRQP